MGQKVNPNGMRIGINKDWSSRWFANDKDYSNFLIEDQNIRNYVEKTIDRSALLSHVDIERKKTDKGYNVTVYIFVGRPGTVIGDKGANIENLRKALTKVCNKANVKVNVIEVKEPNLDAKIVASTIATQLEQRASFRIAQKKAIAMVRKSGARGIKTKVGGRLGGAEIARAEGYRDGTMGINTLKNDIDFALAEAQTTYGKLGVKVWISRGEKAVGKFEEETQKVLDEANAPKKENKPEENKGERRPHGPRQPRANAPKTSEKGE